MNRRAPSSRAWLLSMLVMLPTASTSTAHAAARDDERSAARDDERSAARDDERRAARDDERRAARVVEREWCAPEIETLWDGMCFHAPAEAASAEHPTLVLFLHSLVAVKSDWQWEQQRELTSAADRHAFAILMPRGRTGIGPRHSGDVWAWPTSPATQAQVEDELIAEWRRARKLIEARNGHPFERLLVFGFSNGAYYASTLALRNLLDAHGYGVFAGGSGGKYASVLGSRTTHRAPIFVGYGTKDPAWHDMASLGDTLKSLGWRHQVKAEPVGHLVTAAQLAAAMRFLSSHHPE